MHNFDKHNVVPFILDLLEIVRLLLADCLNKLSFGELGIVPALVEQTHRVGLLDRLQITVNEQLTELLKVVERGVATSLNRDYFEQEAEGTGLTLVKIMDYRFSNLQ